MKKFSATIFIIIIICFLLFSCSRNADRNKNDSKVEMNNIETKNEQSIELESNETEKIENQLKNIIKKQQKEAEKDFKELKS